MSEYEHHVDPIGTRPQLKDLAFERLRGFIIDGRLAPGESICEAAWSARLGISKTPIREALVRLEQEGFVRLEPYRGAIVNGYTSKDIDEIFEVREILEGAMARRLAQTQPAVAIEQLRASVGAADAAARKNDLGAVHEAIAAFEAVVFTNTGNARLEAVLDQTRSHVLRIGHLTTTEAGRVADSLERLRGVVEAIEAGRPATAERLMRHHVRALRNTTMERMHAAGFLT